MKKWYEDERIDEDVVISSRIRLARNIKKYPFSTILQKSDTDKLINEVKDSVINDSNYIGDSFEFIKFDDLSNIDKYSMVENHTVSNDIIKKNNSAALIKNDDSASILINEEDHIRIQSVSIGNDINSAWEFANNIDNLIEERIEYAFDKDFGYLTSCITNTGTGLRASFMIHIPMIEMSGNLANISRAIGKFGMTMRGIYGEGSESLGSIYQISNQITLGKSEKEIIEALKSVTNQIIEQEKELRNNVIKNNSAKFEDKIYRSYGILCSCRQISSKEAMKLLSDVRLGFMTKILKFNKPEKNIYNIMMNVQPGNLIKLCGKNLSETERDIERAKYLNEQLRKF